jgi:Na+-translocating ferredoxin:NAD+ oxidoreductase subunit B
MGTTILYTILSLSILGIIAAIILFFVAKKFAVIEDPRIDLINEALPSANCGGCGFAGCRNFAENCVNAESLEGLFCPVGGNDVMNSVAKILGREASAKEPRVAVLVCNGTCEARPQTNIYDGAGSCAIASALYAGNTGCQFGCLGYGDCVDVCQFGALRMDPFTGLPVVDDALCTACGNCLKACPKNLFELRKRAKKEMKIYVACRNEEKGGIAKKSCSVACIGCNKCVKVCPHDAITLINNLAFIDSDLCKLCRKCVPECPTNSIIEVGFPKKKEKTVELTSDIIDSPRISSVNNLKPEEDSI